MRRGYWILDENRVPKQVDLFTWAIWFEKTDRIVRQEWVGDIRISTVFMGIDHNWSDKGPPILWETMAFSNRKNMHLYRNRCAGSWEQAEAMHEVVVREACEIEQITYKPMEQRQ